MTSRRISTHRFKADYEIEIPDHHWCGHVSGQFHYENDNSLTLFLNCTFGLRDSGDPTRWYKYPNVRIVKDTETDIVVELDEEDTLYLWDMKWR